MCIYKRKASALSSRLFHQTQLISKMGSMLTDWPSFDPHNFSQHRPSDPSNPSKMTPVTYRPTHDKTLPPPDQVITSESRNALLRHFYMRNEEKVKAKRPASGNLAPEPGTKHHRASSSTF